MTPTLRVYQPFLNAGEFSDIYIEESSSFSIRWEDGKIESMTANEEAGAGLRYIRDQESRFGRVDLASPLKGVLTRDEMEKLTRVQKDLSEGLVPLNPKEKPFLDRKDHLILIDPRTVSLDKKIALLKKAFAAANQGPHVRQITINYGEKLKRISYLNSKGENFSEERIYTVFSLTVIAERDKVLQTAYDSMGGVVGFELFDGDRLEKLSREISVRAHNKLLAPQAPVGSMPIVIASSAGGTLIHEAVGHSLEADAVLDGTSPSYVGKMGKVVGRENLNVFDDPTVPSARGSFHFDDEGTPSERTHLIENGVLKNLLYDRLSAKRGGVSSNGHGRRESYAYPPIPRMSNTFVSPGPDHPPAILSSFQNGLLVTKMGGGQVNTANGDFVFDVEEGFSVKEGVKTLVRGATLLGNGPQVLMDMEQIGTDHGWAIGTCGKEGQGVPVADALPTVKIKSLVVGGS